jgi:hypothetical protein
MGERTKRRHRRLETNQPTPAMPDSPEPKTIEVQTAQAVDPAAICSGTVAVSQSFERAFSSGSGGCVRDCDCGRTNYDYANSWDWDDGELEALIENAKAEPDRYIGHDHSVSTMDVSGKEIVMGCPCNSARRFEDWIILHAAQIAEYLNSRADAAHVRQFNHMTDYEKIRDQFNQGAECRHGNNPRLEYEPGCYAIECAEAERCKCRYASGEGGTVTAALIEWKRRFAR